MPDAPVVQFIRNKSGIAPLAVQRCVVSRSHGIAPAALTLDIQPTDPDNLLLGDRQGKLLIRYDGNHLEIEDCIIDQAALIASTGNLVSRIVIMDRRWKWQYGRIDGHYNRRTETGKLIAGQGDEVFNTVRTTRQLARKLMLSMGVYNNERQIEALPEGTGPEVQWETDNPARELAQLCEQFGCRVVMQWDNTVNIWRLGQYVSDSAGKREWASPQERAAERRAQRLARLAGKTDNPPLPSVMPVITYSEAVDSVERPDRIDVTTAPVVHQWDFELEAVGEDEDGTVKVLKDLSFAPNKNGVDGGFGGSSGMFSPASGLHPTTADKNIRKLANKSVYRWYRIKTPFEFPGNFFNEDDEEEKIEIRYLAEIKPIIDGLVTTTIEDGLIVNRPAVVYGKYQHDVDNNVTKVVPLPHDDTIKTKAGIKCEDMIAPPNWYLDTKKGIVKFTQPIVQVNTSGYYQAAELRLRASFELRNRRNGSWIKNNIYRTQPEPRLGTGPLVIKRPDLIPVREARFGDTFTDITIADNQPLVKELATEHINAVEDTFTGSRPTQLQYAGFYPQIDLDGVVRTVSFVIDVNDSSAPIRTIVEIDQDMPGYEQLAYVQLRQSQQLLQLRSKQNVLTPRLWARRINRERQN